MPPSYTGVRGAVRLLATALVLLYATATRPTRPARPTRPTSVGVAAEGWMDSRSGRARTSLAQKRNEARQNSSFFAPPGDTQDSNSYFKPLQDSSKTLEEHLDGLLAEHSKVDQQIQADAKELSMLLERQKQNQALEISFTEKIKTLQDGANQILKRLQDTIDNAASFDAKGESSGASKADRDADDDSSQNVIRLSSS
eukprot:TRINITY_DN57509_c0_g1_i1.p1 TRINITY_DN57509_c0_g1~~TRINITY_DN57509_c0_g1_i1.p1  ORF type:complete len:198 (+),score=28.02 TRINITY_DN57509_c0_g1_i1:119-712(+)